MLRKNTIWIAWERHRRTDSLARKLSVPLYVCVSRVPRILKHPYFVIKTILIILRNRPRILFVQNPSAFLTLMAILLKPIFKYFLVVDAHNAGVYPFEAGHEKYRKVFPFMHRYADRTIVTNSILADIITGNGGHPVILPDPLPFLGGTHTISSESEKFAVTFICSYSSDEPYMEVIKAAEKLPDDIQISITGDDSKLSQEERDKACGRVRFTGFLVELEYVSLLKSSDVIMDLTTFDDCLVCGAYEAVSLGVPLILSDSIVLRSWFFKGAVYTCHTSSSLCQAILEAKNRHSELKNEIIDLRGEIDTRWNELYVGLLEELPCAII